METYFLKKVKDKWVIKEEFLTRKAEEVARDLVGNNPQKPKLKSSQLRKFYNEVKSLAAKAEVEGFERVKPLVRMLKAKVSYQKGRGVVPADFVRFISENVDKIQGEADFTQGFVKHFEAVVGYYYGIAEKFE
jgi:CRISPR-associated protein Csm2